jgi:glutamate-1-semialdehyde 2,1-aminomutase
MEKIKKNKNNLLWTEAKKIILGGNGLFSKRPENFLPFFWPAYFSKAKGCYVWDLTNKKYIDMSLMGIGTNVLGYANKKVDDAVIRNLKKGNMTTLNCPEEVFLAKKLKSIHPWASKVKFARTGGEANAIAIRIARAFTKQSKIAICGYHGWHDWYLSANLNKKNAMKKFLLKGLKNDGIPQELKNTVFTFEYNNLDRLEYLLKEKKIKIIKMEVIRNVQPKNNFLKKVRKLANKYNSVLIFDECTTGFRQSYGGIHKYFKVTPDMVIFGKAIGNGYAITAILGKKKVMAKAEGSFISSTFWSERSGPTAALETIKIMKSSKSWLTVKNQGKKVKFIWNKISKKYGLKISIYGIDSICGFNFEYKKNNYFKSILTFEMLKLGFLAGNSIMISICHTDNILKKYEKALDKVFKIIADIKDLKKRKINLKQAFQGFYRLN